MKQFILFITFLSIFSCKQADPNQLIIDSYLQEIAMGVKLENDFKEIKHIKDVKSSELLDDLYKQLEFENTMHKDTVLKKLDNFLSKDYIEDKEVWQFKRDRFNHASKNDANLVSYSLIEATHEFKNPLINNALMSVTRTYIIGDGKVLGAIEKKDYEKYKKEYSKTPLLMYEVAIAEQALKDKL
jgi:hypothetical protein